MWRGNSYWTICSQLDRFCYRNTHSNNCGVQIPSYWMKLRKQNSPSLDKIKDKGSQWWGNSKWTINILLLHENEMTEFFSLICCAPPQIESSHLPFASLNVLIIEKSAMETPNLGEVLDTCKGNSNWSPATGPYCKFQDILTARLQWTICSPFNQNVQRDQGISGENFCCNG